MTHPLALEIEVLIVLFYFSLQTCVKFCPNFIVIFILPYMYVTDSTYRVLQLSSPYIGTEKWAIARQISKQSLSHH